MLLASYAQEIEAALGDEKFRDARLYLLANAIRNLAVDRASARLGKTLDAGTFS